MVFHFFSGCHHHMPLSTTDLLFIQNPAGRCTNLLMLSSYCDTSLQGEFDSRVSTYLKKELVRIHNKEKTWREKLWRNGIIRSSPMSPREQPEYVGTEEVI